MPSPLLAPSPPVLPDLLRGPAEWTTSICDLGTRLGAAEPRQRQASAAGEASPHPRTLEPLLPRCPVHFPPTCPIPLPSVSPSRVLHQAPSLRPFRHPPRRPRPVGGHGADTHVQPRHCCHLNHSAVPGGPAELCRALCPVRGTALLPAPHQSQLLCSTEAAPIPKPTPRNAEAERRENRSSTFFSYRRPEPRQSASELPEPKVMRRCRPARRSARGRRLTAKSGAGARGAQRPELESIATRVASGAGSGTAEPPRELTPFPCPRTTGGDTPAA